MRVIIIILMIYIGWRLFWRYVFPLLLTLVVKKAAEKMQGGTFYYSTDTREQRRREGEVTIDQTHAKKSVNQSREDGEYVDYEEVK